MTKMLIYPTHLHNILRFWMKMWRISRGLGTLVSFFFPNPNFPPSGIRALIRLGGEAGVDFVLDRVIRGGNTHLWETIGCCLWRKKEKN